MKLIFSAPVNSLSLGNVSVNLLKEMHKRNIDLTFFPVNENLDFKAYKLNQDFADWFGKSVNNRLLSVKKDTPSLKLWHIAGSEQKLSDKQYLFSFYEASEPTKEEVNLVNLQEETFFSSNYSINLFNNLGCKTSFVPLGFDKEFSVLPKKESDIITFGLIGKWEKRKHTEKIIKLWLKLFGNDFRYRLICCVNNPFYKPEQMQSVLINALEGKKYFNVNFIPYLETNAEINSTMNHIDIDLSGLSGAEGWGLPSFNMTALGKWSVVLNATAHKDWANKKNSILVEPVGEESIVDNIFFKPNAQFNKGIIYSWSEEHVVEAMKKAISLAKTKNTEGLKLQEQYTWSKTLDIILEKMKVT